MIPNAKPDIHEEEIAAVEAVLRSGWLTSGPEVEKFEEEFAAACGDNLYAVAVSSATAGLHLALAVRGANASVKTVAVPTWTFTATAHAVEMAGLTPVFQDVDYHTLLMLPPRNAPFCLGAVPVHIAGCRPDATGDLTGYTVEDAAHCLPYDPGGNLAVFSFYATKPIACGEGGMIVTQSITTAAKLRQMRYHGLDAEVWDRHKLGYNEHQVVTPGYKYNMSDISAAIGRVQLQRAPAMREGRRAICERYRSQIKGMMFPPSMFSKARDSNHLFIGRVPDNRLFIEQMRTREIACNLHYKPLHTHQYWKNKYSLKEEDFPNANLAARHAVSLPLHSSLTDADVEAVIKAANEVL